ncbi:MAG: diguanylate cyclase [Clostridiales Family XIII bacterium]|nr:diguanylate cyclase [Clostridiales Family XIII bacterium]
MTNTIVQIALVASIALSGYLIAVTILNCRSEKKNLFIFCLIGLLFYTLGNFMEVSATDTGGALTGVKVMYVGVCFMSPLFLLFLSDYCEIRLPALVKALLVALPTFNLGLVWTTEKTNLIYKEYTYTAETRVHGLMIVEQGPLYYLVYGTAIVCIAISVGIILRCMNKWDKSYTLQLLLFLFASVAPMLANFLYLGITYIAHTDPHGINFTPFAILITNLILYFGVLRYDLFDFSTRAQSASFDMIRDAFIYLDGRLRYSSANAFAKELFPDLARTGKGSTLEKITGWPLALRGIDGSQEYRDISFTLPGKDGGEERAFNAWVHRVMASGKTIGIIILIQDVTENVRLMKQLETAAYTDGLTGLYNRRYFLDHALKELDRAQRTNSPASLIMLDLDHFKVVNDTYGHAAGDEVLRTVSNRLRSAVRTYDIVARYGGEEFVIFLANADINIGRQLAERIRLKVEEKPCVYLGEEIPFTCSLGVAELHADVENLDELIRRADEALYNAKESGRNQVATYAQPA